LIHAGDVSWVGSEPQLIDFFKWFDRQAFKHKIFIAGNHDLMFEQNPKQAQSLIPKSIIYLEESCVTIEGLKIYGTPITPYFFNWAFNRYPGQDIEQHMRKIPNDTDILISHGPPYGILDANAKGEHCGCPSMLSKIQEVKPKLLICGHIHEGYGRLPVVGVARRLARMLTNNDFFHSTHFNKITFYIHFLPCYLLSSRTLEKNSNVGGAAGVLTQTTAESFVGDSARLPARNSKAKRKCGCHVMKKPRTSRGFLLLYQLGVNV
jgi:predicted phosphohydrolase